MGFLIFAIMVLTAALVFGCAAYFRDKWVLLLSPTAIFCLSWCGSATMYLFGQDFLREKTVLAICLFYVSFVIPSLAILLCFGASLTRPNLFIPYSARRCTRVSRFLLFLQAIALLSAACHFYYAVELSGQKIWAISNMAEIRGILATKDYGVPFFFKLIGQARYVNYLAPIILLAFFQQGCIRTRRLILSLVLACGYFAFFLERSGILRIFIILAIVYFYLFVRRLADTRRVIASLLAMAAVIIFVIPTIRGQANEGGSNPYTFVVGAWAGFDAFVSGYDGEIATLEDQDVYISTQGYEFGSAPLGLETFTEFYRICNAFSFCSVRIPNNKEYIYIPIMTNIYTMARSFYEDFGMYGLPLAVSAFALIITWLYLVAIRRGGVFYVYLVAYMGYVCAMSILADNLLARDMIFVCLIAIGLSMLFGGRRFYFGGRRSN